MSRRSEKEEAAHLQYETEHTAPGKTPSVLPYLAILVAAAFILLVMAYFMQQRTAESVQGLHDSVTTIRSIDQLVEDNRDLEDQLATLKEERAALQQELDEAKGQLAQRDSQQSDEARRLNALNALNELRALYNDRRYQDARNLLETWGVDLEVALSEIKDGLPQEELDIYDPLDAYQRLVRLLG